MNHRYGVWKPKENSRPTLIVTDDDGNTYTKVAVFSNDESVNIFEQWLLNALVEVFIPGGAIIEDWEEPEINPCRGCTDYDGQGGCKSNGACGDKRK